MQLLPILTPGIHPLVKTPGGVEYLAVTCRYPPPTGVQQVVYIVKTCRNYNVCFTRNIDTRDFVQTRDSSFLSTREGKYLAETCKYHTGA